MPTPVHDRVYLITGSASGMGLATAQTLLYRGAKVAACDINEKNLEEFYNDLEPTKQKDTLTGLVDVRNKGDLRKFAQQAKSHFGRLDGVANFAGTGGHELGTESVWETSDDEYDFIMDINVRGLFNTLSVVLVPGFLEPGASVVHIASMFALKGFKDGAVFAASKHAALGMARSAAKETEGSVRVNCVLPGVIDTPMHRANLARVKNFVPAPTTPIARDGTAQEVANVVLFLLGSESSFVTGDAWSVDGGANA